MIIFYFYSISPDRWAGNLYSYNIFNNYSVFFIMGTKAFVHLTHLKLLQISQTYLKILVWSGLLIKIHIELFLKKLEVFSIFYQEGYVVQFKHKCDKQTTTVF